MTRHRIGTISDKAVEAAARATCQVSWEMFDPMQQAAILADVRNILQAALPVLLEGKAEEIARVIRETVKADATGLAPAVIGHHLYGFEDATNRIISILTGESDA